MKNFTFENPTKIIFGKGTIAEIGSEMANRGVKKTLLVYGRQSIKKNGVFEQVTQSLQAAGVAWVEFSGIQSNPLLSKVREGIALAKAEGVEAVLAVGGGSVYDSSKAIAAGSVYDGDVWDFFGRRKVASSALPIFGVLTISATGSEMNALGVVTNEDAKKKWSLYSPAIYPKVSVIDPSIQATLPADQTANAAVDIIAHVMELYFDGSENNDIMDEYSEGIIRTVIKHGPVLLADPANYESRAQLAWCATLALNGSNAPGRRGGDFASHGIEHALSAWNNIAHGAGLAIIFPAWMKYVWKNNPMAFLRFGEKVFDITSGGEEKRVMAAITALQAFFKKMGAPLTLREAGYKKEDLPSIAEIAASLGPVGNKRKLGQEDILAILELAW